MKTQLNRFFSFLLIFSLTFGGYGQAQAQTQAQSPANGAAAMPMPGETPHYFGPYPNWANSPQVLADAIVTISPAAPTPGSVGNPLIDRAYATDFVASPPVIPASVSLAAARKFNMNVGSATGGGFTLTVNAVTTTSIAFNAAAADVETALAGAGVTATVSGSGSIADPWVITFAATPTSVTMDSAGLTQGVTDSAASGAADTYNVNVGSATGGTFTLTVDAATTTPIAFNAAMTDIETALAGAGVTATVSGSGSIADPWVIIFSVAPTSVTMDSAGLTRAVADSAANSVADTYNVNVGSAIGGTFTLTVDSAITAPIAFDAATTAVEAALSGAGVIATASGSGSIANPWVITFAVAPISVAIDGAGLTQPAAPALVPVLVVVPTPLPTGIIQAFETWNQAAAGGSPTPSAGNTFHAYVLRLVIGTTDQYQVVFDSGTLTVPPLAVPGVSEIATFPMANIPVTTGDVIAFYGAGIPVDTGTGSDIFSFPAPNAPVQGNTITVGDPATFPLYGQMRSYSIAATVTPAFVDPGTGAEATATVNPKTGAISAITITNPGSGYLVAPTISITSPGVTPTTLADATAAISLGVVNSIVVDETGFGFSAPAVTITGGNPTPGSEATGVASGGVDNITLDYGGSGYVTQAFIEFSLPDLLNGVQATGTATMDPGGFITGVSVVDSGSGYTSAPTVTFSDVNGSVLNDPATATATIGIGQIDVTSGGQGYDSAPTVTITDVGGVDRFASATATVAVRGAVTAITVNNAGSGYLTPGLKKFVDTLPGLGPNAANNLGQYIPVAVPDTITYPGSDYYEIAVVQYRMKFHTYLPPTLLRGYVQLSTGVVPGNQVPLSNENLNPAIAASPIVGYTGVDNPHYLGPTIVATKDRPVRILFRNLLPTGVDGNLFIPVDTSVMGAGAGPNMMQLDANGVPMDMHPDEGTVTDMVRNPMCGEIPKPADCYSENRATLHLHGGITPWISDGTPHQWTTPVGEATSYPQGVSVSNVPDMPDPGPGAMTFFYTNQQSARLMFYHDHAWGITRLNVYAGEAAGYLLTDDMEQALIAPGGALDGLGLGTPLVIQDKTFVPSAAQMAMLDPTWQADRWGGEGSLWVPHVYMPAQNPGDPSGMSAFGRWMYGPWFWPPAGDAKYPPIANPYYDPTCDPNVEPFCEPPLIPSTPNVSVGMEAFNDTPIVNGTAYPTTTVDPKAYRFRILNAANDRFWNLSWYVADPRTGTLSEVALNAAELAAAQTDPVVVPTPDTTWSPKGPNWIQIGTEGGFLPTPAVIPAGPTVWVTDPTRFDVGNVDSGSLILAPAERADVIVDFSQFRGKTLILYNDAPAAFPARVPGYDYYTGGPDLSPSGAPTTLPGYGPNTRTIMQVKVSSAAPAIAFDRPNTTADRMGALMTAFGHHADGSGVFESSMDPIIVGQAAYNSAYGTNFATNGWCNSPTNPSTTCDGYARIAEQGGDLFGFNTLAAPNARMQIPLEPKGIHDEMNSANFDEWGRMSANLGLEAPGITPLLQNIILYPYVNPSTEILDTAGMPSSLDVTPITSAADGTQIWKITHNGVDTHPIHWHMFNIQLINRVAWDNIIQPPAPNELGWKDTVRINPLQDTYVAVRPIVPTVPFGVPDSVRPLNPMMPIGARGAQNGVNGNEAGFNNTNANGIPIPPIINEIVNFGWEYVWHCHILSHEEMDMMRPISVFVARALPDAPLLTFTRGSVILNWSDGTPVNYADPTTWANPKSEIGYRIERAVLDINGQPGAYSVIAMAPANTTSFTDFTTIPGWNYNYRVTAFNAAGDSSSNELTVLTLPPADPTNLVAAAINAYQVDLTWTDNATTETGFRIERALVTGGITGLFAAIDGVGADITAYTDPTVAANTTYAYRVFAFNMGGDSLPSNEATVTTPDVPPLAAANLTATAINTTQVDLNWVDNAANETGFRIERALVTGGIPDPFAALDTVGANATNYSDITAVPNTTYAYQVFAFNVLGDSLPSNIATASTPDVPPAGPTTLVASAVNANRVDLTWTDNAATETGFSIERALVTGGIPGPFVVIDGVGVNITAYTDLTVVANTTYAYRVFAFNLGGDSLPSNEATVTTPDVPPTAPAGLSAVLQNGPQVGLAWTDNANNETSFVVERAVNGGAFVILATLPADTISYVDTAVAAGTTYTYQVMAANAGGPSAYSNTASVTLVPLPAAPTNLTATLVSLTRIDLAWLDNATTETGFVVERAVNGGAFAILTTVPTRAGTGNVTYRDTTVVSGNIYSYRVVAINASGSSAYSNVVVVTVGAAPAAPTNLTGALLGNPIRVRLTWRDNATNETNLVLERAANGGAFTMLATLPLRNGTGNVTYNDTTVLGGNTYVYRVMAVNGVGPSAYSNTFTMSILPPAAPSNFTATAVVSGANAIVTLTWTDNSNNEANFEIQRATNATFTAGLNTSTLAANTTLRVETRNRNRTYYYRIRAINAAGVSVWVNVTPFPIVTP